MSFRARLTVFFALIVVVPMLALAALLVQVTSEARTGKADARLGKALETARAVYSDRVSESRASARRLAGDRRLAAALRGRRIAALRRAAERAPGAAVWVGIAGPDGETLTTAGTDRPVASTDVQLRQGERLLGTVTVASTDAASYAREVRRLTSLYVELRRGGESLARTSGLDRSLPAEGEVDIEGEELRTASLTLRDSQGAVRLTLAGPLEDESVAANRLLIGGALLAFFILATAFAVVLVRSLQGQIQTMLDAARRIGGGDFDIEVPAEGRDEMAGLAGEFNKMSRRLEAQIDELRRQRERVAESIRRMGEAFATGLDRDGALQVVADAAVDACSADAGRVCLDEEPGAVFPAGSGSAGAASLLLEAAEQAAPAGGPPVSIDRGAVHAAACRFALKPSEGSDDLDAEPREAKDGTVAVLREGQGFTEGELGILDYLARQAAIAVGQAERHALVAYQAVTDELTGLANNRRFQETLEREISRAERFGHSVGLVMLDLDDFKQVNDTYGHLQGDAVLRGVASTLRDHSRTIDEPARYGGEELAVVLPETDAEGAMALAERIREAIAARPIEMVENGGSLNVTASFGIACYPEHGRSPGELVEAADAALYGAKRAGKNRSKLARRGT